MEANGLAVIAEVEDEFEIEVSEPEAARVRSLGELAEVVHSRVRQDPEAPCPSPHRFYVLRRILMGRFGLPRSAIRPDTALAELFPRSTRPADWSDLIDSLSSGKSQRVALVRSRWMSRSVFLLLPALALILTSALAPAHLLWLGILTAAGVAALAARCTSPFKTEFPAGLSRVEDLTRLVATLDCKVWSREEVVERIRHLSRKGRPCLDRAGHLGTVGRTGRG